MPVRDEKMTKIVAGMGVADMDFRCAPAITEALQKRVAFPNWGYNMIDGDLFMGTAGNTPFVKGIIDWNKRRYGINIDPKMVGISAGVIPGVISALQAFAPKGSKVLMVTPSYVGFYAAIGITKTVAEESPMKLVNGRYEIDWADFERRMTPDVKVSILCNPHNPVGRTWTRDELVRYGQLCKKHNIIVLSDEIHCDFISKGQKYMPFATLGQRHRRQFHHLQVGLQELLAGGDEMRLVLLHQSQAVQGHQRPVPALDLQSGDRGGTGGLCRRRRLAEPVRRLCRRQSGLCP